MPTRHGGSAAKKGRTSARRNCLRSNTLPRRVNAVDLEYVLRQIQPDRGNLLPWTVPLR